MPRRQRNVSIKANAVNVTPTQNKGKSRRSRSRNRRGTPTNVFGDPQPRRNSTRQRRELVMGPPIGIQSGLAELTPKPQRVRARSVGVPVMPSYTDVTDMLSEQSPFTEQAAEFFELYCDPCGEHCCATDAARVPDGALATSAGAFLRYLETIAFPWQESGTTDLSGKTYSMLFLQLPLFRSLTFVIARRNDGEFGPDTMDRFVRTFANLVLIEDAFYPNWVSLADPDDAEFFTALDTAALRNIVPPIDGVSGTVDSYRFSSQGLNIKFNTPDLVDQGTYVAMRYPTNLSTHNAGIANELAGALPSYLTGHIVLPGTGVLPGDASLSLNVSGSSNPLLPSYTGLFSGLPSPGFIATAAIQNAAGTFTIAIGDSVSYTTAGNNILLTNNTSGESITFGTVPILNLPSILELSLRLYQTTLVDGGPEDAVDFETTNIVLPPLTQADMFQQNPKLMATLAKDTNGVYSVGSIFQPVFNVTSSQEYRKIVLQRHGTKVIDLINPLTGWSDTVDKNFGITIVNFQGIPYACKPFVKISRSVEIVPSSDSFAGAFATGTPPAQPEAIDACKAFTDAQPHGYPSDYNSLGLLFGKALKVIEMLPQLHRSGRNISRCVKEICDAEATEDVGSSMGGIVTLGLQGLKRLARLR